MSGAVLPCLKAPLWAGREVAVCRPLWPEQKSSPYMPWLAFGYDHPENFEFIANDRLPVLKTTRHALESEAIENLRQRPAAWRPFDREIDGRLLRMLVCANDFLAAERILDREFIREAERTLGTRGVLVGIPYRGLLVVTDGAQDLDTAQVFGAIVADRYTSGDAAPITPALFGTEDGAIVAFIDAVAEHLVPADTLASPARALGTPERAAPAPVRAAPMPAARAPEPAKPMFSWWTSLPSWVRLGVGLVIGLLILNRILVDMVSAWLP